MRGRIDRFSVDTLITLLGKLGVEVRVTLRAHRAA
jgi:predicted XRE-type DNA-binding protein